MNRFETILSLLILLSPLVLSAQLHGDYLSELVSDEFDAPIGIEFIDSSRALVWQRKGQIYILENLIKQSEPILDISEEVAHYGDLGLLEVILHPDFNNTPLIYLSYTVDPHHLRHYGSDDYETKELGKWNATIGRVTSYRLDPDQLTIDPDSRLVIIGKTIQTGVPTLAPAHGIADLAFANDKSLLISTGDGTTWVDNHTGGPEYKLYGYDSLGLVDKIIPTDHDLGSYRSQLIGSLNGKVLRVDPLSGNGLLDNPFYTGNPSDPESKVWALGFRSPYRMTVLDNQNSMSPGTIIIGDVGSNQYEEINIIAEGGRNFGWPSFEGQVPNNNFTEQFVEFPTTLNPLFDNDICTIQQFRFNDLLIPNNASHDVVWTNPCAEVPIVADVPMFVHEPPALSYGNTINHPNQVHLPSFNSDGNAAYTDFITKDSEDPSVTFDGISSIAVGEVPAQFYPYFQQPYIHADFSGWIRIFNFDPNDLTFTDVDLLYQNPMDPIAYAKYNPFDNSLYYIILDYEEGKKREEIHRIILSQSRPPIISASVHPTHGPSGQVFTFDGSNSFDPNGDPLEIEWRFHDGTSQKGTIVQKVISVDNDIPQNVLATIIASDGELNSTDSIAISLNNTPPHVMIMGLEDSSTYSIRNRDFDVVLSALVQDLEHQGSDLSYNWKVILNHNDHSHLEFETNEQQLDHRIFTIENTPLDKYSFSFVLSVVDPLGLVGSDYITIFPENSVEVKQEEYVLFPNPTEHSLNLRIRTIEDEFNEPYTYRLYDINYRLIDVKDFTKTGVIRYVPISIKDLTPGTYFIQLDDKHTTRFTGKFTKI